MSDKQGYNGWKNYETWNVNLWLSNDEGLYNYTRDTVAEAIGQEPEYEGQEPTARAARAIEALVNELPEVIAVQEQASMVSDLFGAALSGVDWYEIAPHWIEDES